MTDPHPSSDQIWQDAETYVQRLENAARLPSPSFFEDLTQGLRLFSNASLVGLRVHTIKDHSVLAQSGIGVFQSLEALPEVDESVPRARWQENERESRFTAVHEVLDDRWLVLDIRFDQSPSIAIRQPLAELSEVVLDLAAKVHLQSYAAGLESQLEQRQNRDSFIAELSRGIGLTDSFASIAAVVAERASVDRVSVLLRKPRCRLVATSTQPRIDRRARQVRLLQQLADESVTTRDFSYSIGEPFDEMWQTPNGMTEYLHESGCREIHLAPVGGWHDRGTLSESSKAVIVLERFRGAAESEVSIEEVLDGIREPINTAVANAITREDAGWGLIVSRFVESARGPKGWLPLVSIVCLLLAAAVVPMELKIPVEGRVTAAQSRHLFATAAGVVEQISVENGERVQTGQPLLTLHSAVLDLQQRNLEASVVTARARLDSLLSLRSRNRESAQSSSAEEQVLRAEIDGLKQQLDVVQQHQDALTIRSPIDGVVHRWELKQSLEARPVTQGQFLFDVVSEVDGWELELDVPDKNINYVLQQSAIQPCEVTFRMRSEPTQLHQSVITEVADVAHVNASGKSMVRATVKVDSIDESAKWRSGASVLAQVHCGSRSVGFVWTRGLIEWWRSNDWF